MQSRFNPQSLRAIRGLAFQDTVESCLDSKFQSVLNSRKWMLKHDECLSDIQLNMLEQTWGDVVIIDPNIPYPIFIECVSIGQDMSIFPEHKIKKFNGVNKYYCFGWDDEQRFVGLFQL